jgi:hypothetical protein
LSIGISGLDNPNTEAAEDNDLSFSVPQKDHIDMGGQCTTGIDTRLWH